MDEVLNDDYLDQLINMIRPTYYKDNIPFQNQDVINKLITIMLYYKEKTKTLENKLDEQESINEDLLSEIYDLQDRIAELED